ncbi:hypothetical protein L227DRAFT_107980 [Lentinus tigrinus ALCF2SS1-6]|uniref:Uncharacterized protein n=1 Tax=Lentinus tigrinus ALCF2SS1-6 TaxID=1328759 RepID=A0A5C2S8S8_9APHY|nr:hypothetical protein L227DRAFT_107980 [Lentinus tigrinus ALCF2SS1-6]
MPHAGHLAQYQRTCVSVSWSLHKCGRHHSGGLVNCDGTSEATGRSSIFLPRAVCLGVLRRAAQHRRARFNVRASDLRACACGIGGMGVVCLGYAVSRRSNGQKTEVLRFGA